MTPEHLRTLREARGLTRDELAAELGGCTAQAIVKWERGERPIPTWVQEKMLSNISVTLPLSDLHTLLDYARNSGESFEAFLTTAIRNSLAWHSQTKTHPTSHHTPPLLFTAQPPIFTDEHKVAETENSQEADTYPTNKVKYTAKKKTKKT